MNAWGEEDISIKNEDFDSQTNSHLTFDIEREIINASIASNKMQSSSSNKSFEDICTDLDIAVNSVQNITENNEIKIMTEQDLAAEYLINSNMMKDNNIKSDSINLQDLTNDIFPNSKTALDMNNKYDLNSIDLVESGGMAANSNLDSLNSNSQDEFKNRLHFVKYVNRDGRHVKIWECGVCSKEFGHQYTLMRHLPTHTDERKFQCNTCGKAFRQMSTLSQHRAIHSADRPYVCELCKKTFNRVSTLISHRKTHSGLKPHQCHLCHKAFHQKGNLRNHIFTHTNERPYKCDVCEKGFNQMSNLMCHKSKAHQRSDKPKYTCRLCNKEFPKRMALRNHEEYKHGIKNQPADSMSSSSSSNNDMPTPAQTITIPNIDENRAAIQSRIVQNENGEKMHIIHIPELNSSTTSMVPPTAPSNARVRYTNGVLVDAINTGAMRQAQQAQLASGTMGSSASAPFALLRPIGGIPVLVRVLSAPNGKHMLVPATAEDLRAHGKITITENKVAPDEEVTKNKTTTTVQIKIPVVATVVQKLETDGTMSMSVESPGPDNKQMIQDSIYNTVENHRNMQINQQQLQTEYARSSASTFASTHSNNNYYQFENNSYNIKKSRDGFETINLDDPMPSLPSTSGIISSSMPYNHQSTIPSNQLYTTEQIDSFNNYQMMVQSKLNTGTVPTYSQDIILGESNLYNDVNGLSTIYHQQSEYSILQ